MPREIRESAGSQETWLTDRLRDLGYDEERLDTEAQHDVHKYEAHDPVLEVVFR